MSYCSIKHDDDDDDDDDDYYNTVDRQFPITAAIARWSSSSGEQRAAANVCQ